MTNLETEPAPLPPPTPLSPPHENRWARSADRVVLGVAGGLGRALALEPVSEFVTVCSNVPRTVLIFASAVSQAFIS